MRIAVTGSTGLIGTALTAALRADGDDVVRLVRHTHPDEAAGERHWSPFGDPDPGPFEGCDAVVHLAGAGLGDHRWSAAYKREIVESRVHGTDTLARSLALCPEPPRALLSGSAIGWYGDTGSRAVTESAPYADTFLGRLCRDWEAAARPASEAGIPVTNLRTGIVLDGRGGALGRMLLPFKLGVGGPIAGGRQYFSFIGMGDYLAAVKHVMALTLDGAMSGPVNMTGPQPVTNKEFSRALGRAVHRPAVMPIPGTALRVALGQMSGELTTSQRVLPGQLAESGFGFRTPGVDEAIAIALEAAG